jgi:hypothetical protein
MKQFMRKIITATLLIVAINTYAQIGVNSSNSAPDASAMLDVSSSTKGLLIPRMTTTQRNAITSPALGLLVFDTNFNQLFHYNGFGWVASNFWNKKR